MLGTELLQKIFFCDLPKTNKGFKQEQEDLSENRKMVSSLCGTQTGS